MRSAWGSDDKVVGIRAVQYLNENVKSLEIIVSRSSYRLI